MGRAPDGEPFGDEEAESLAAVFIEVEPLEDYTDRYDRAYRSTLWRRGPTPWRQQFGVTDQKKLHELRWQRRRSSQETNADLLRELEEQKLRDGFSQTSIGPAPYRR